jgi:CheY-like chemotaxis protein
MNYRDKKGKGRRAVKKNLKNSAERITIINIRENRYRMNRIDVMVVEDEFVVAEDIKERLQSMGYNVCCLVHTGKDAVDQCVQISPDLILMDVVLKGEMDGVEAASIIHSETPVPIVFLTAYSVETVLRSVKSTEPFGFILKPFDDRELSAVIEMALYKAEMEGKLRGKEQKLLAKNRQLQKALAEIKTLSGLLPICSHCKKIRDDDGYWHQVEKYIQDHSEIKFSHSLCPECARRLYPDIADRLIDSSK